MMLLRQRKKIKLDLRVKMVKRIQKVKVMMKLVAVTNKIIWLTSLSKLIKVSLEMKSLQLESTNGRLLKRLMITMTLVS